MISNMGQLKKIKKQRPDIIMGIMGCTAEHRGKGLFNSLPHLDFVCGTGNIGTIPDIIKKIIKKREKELHVGKLSGHLPEANPRHRNDKRSAYVSISRGCNNYCTYCIVPYVRGNERSRRPDDIIKEVEDLLVRGYVNITLLGQNVNSYGKDLEGNINFVKLLRAMDALNGKKNIKFMTSHPKDASIELFETMGELKGISKHLHLPAQSGSDKILLNMNRRYDSKYYLSKIKHFRKIVPDHMLTTDVIVGFPGETEKDFEATKSLLKQVRFNAAYIFKYSPRPPAPSSKMEDDVPREVKEKRHRELLVLQKSISKNKRILYD